MAVQVSTSENLIPWVIKHRAFNIMDSKTILFYDHTFLHFIFYILMSQNNTKTGLSTIQ